MRLTSPAFAPNGMIPQKYTCDGEDINPTLHIAELPAGTRSLCLIVSDPDAPSGDFVHWLLWNMDPTLEEIREGTVPLGASEGFNDFPSLGWGGPCPPSGIHRYEFRLYALSELVDLPAASDKRALRDRLNDYLLEEACLTGRYGRDSG